MSKLFHSIIFYTQNTELIKKFYIMLLSHFYLTKDHGLIERRGQVIVCMYQVYMSIFGLHFLIQNLLRLRFALEAEILPACSLPRPLTSKNP